ncbi:TPA_asm: hypothetical protein vir519_00041 [Caudoviricetes sp. vir519]|nr:TPA_asm: hypothetical protein vir519_00041 [Caudoviricetes sp. vir519]
MEPENQEQNQEQNQQKENDSDRKEPNQESPDLSSPNFQNATIYFNAGSPPGYCEFALTIISRVGEKAADVNSVTIKAGFTDYAVMKSRFEETVTFLKGEPFWGQVHMNPEPEGI